MGKLLSSLRAALGLDLSVPAREEVRCFPMLLHLWSLDEILRVS